MYNSSIFWLMQWCIESGYENNHGHRFWFWNVLEGVAGILHESTQCWLRVPETWISSTTTHSTTSAVVTDNNQRYFLIPEKPQKELQGRFLINHLSLIKNSFCHLIDIVFHTYSIISRRFYSLYLVLWFI